MVTHLVDELLLLRFREMGELVPADGQIRRERFLRLTKSNIAVRPAD